MEVILKHVIKYTVKINSATIVSKKVIHILIVPTRIKKNTMTTTSASPVRKLNPVLKTVQRYEEV